MMGLCVCGHPAWFHDGDVCAGCGCRNMKPDNRDAIRDIIYGVLLANHYRLAADGTRDSPEGFCTIHADDVTDAILANPDVMMAALGAVRAMIGYVDGVPCLIRMDDEQEFGNGYRYWGIQS